MENNPVIKTLLYESIFDFPMTKDEIWRFLISSQKISKEKFNLLLRVKEIKHKNGYYFLSKDTSLGRKEREGYSKKKYKKALIACLILSCVPTIEFIAISGSLSRLSSRRDDDIDLFIGCMPNTIWTSRFLAVVIMKLLGIYRDSSNFKNMICLNMFISTHPFPSSRWDLYNAVEISQMRPIISKNNWYKKFINQNSWIDNYLPNAREESLRIKIKQKKNYRLLSFASSLALFLNFELFIKRVQLFFMKKRTKETISNELLAFHPIDFKKKIMTRYNSLLKYY